MMKGGGKLVPTKSGSVSSSSRLRHRKRHRYVMIGDEDGEAVPGIKGIKMYKPKGTGIRVSTGRGSSNSKKKGTNKKKNKKQVFESDVDKSSAASQSTQSSTENSYRVEVNTDHDSSVEPSGDTVYLEDTNSYLDFVQHEKEEEGELRVLSREEQQQAWNGQLKDFSKELLPSSDPNISKKKKKKKKTKGSEEKVPMYEQDQWRSIEKKWSDMQVISQSQKSSLEQQQSKTFNKSENPILRLPPPPPPPGGRLSRPLRSAPNISPKATSTREEKENSFPKKTATFRISDNSKSAIERKVPSAIVALETEELPPPPKPQLEEDLNFLLDSVMGKLGADDDNSTLDDHTLLTYDFGYEAGRVGCVPALGTCLHEHYKRYKRQRNGVKTPDDGGSDDHSLALKEVKENKTLSSGENPNRFSPLLPEVESLRLQEEKKEDEEEEDDDTANHYDGGLNHNKIGGGSVSESSTTFMSCGSLSQLAE